ncbi:glycosyltransferase [Arthrobacter yangruifuii]|uniref:Glycosyltransferase n=1 Tax=Arthrobacter yangruifuii TaxID=2606616 RepID=A0A5N6MG58_9MICC|nr:glycosyltransferase [Arthrobacter yangruifuii]KAD3515239.1 glycosyltransferase [Arthrobacter yangruifuii]
MTAGIRGAAGAQLPEAQTAAALEDSALPVADSGRVRDGSEWAPAVLQVGGLAGPGAAAGGVWVVARMQSDALARLGAKVELLGGWLGIPPRQAAGPQAPSLPAAAGRPTAAVRFFRMRRPVPGARLRAPVSLALPRYVRRAAAGADVAHVHLCRDFVTCASTLLLGRARVPVVAQTHGMLQPSQRPALRAFDLLITRRILQIPSLWLTLTEDEERGLAALGVDPGRFRRVVNATAEPEQRWSDPDTPVFLFAARLAPRKQPGVFIQAAVQALDAGLDARFAVVGPDQGEAGTVRSLIAASRHADRFEFVGELPSAGVQARMAACTAYVLPALSEPYPMTVLEAAALGTPVILTAQCGLAPLMGRQDAAVVVEPSVSAVRDAMLQLARDPAARERLGGNARQVHRDNWSTRALAQDLLTAYRGVAVPEGNQP